MIPQWKIHPRSQGPSTVYLRNVVTDPTITVGEYTTYDDFVRDPRDFQRNNVLYHYPECDPERLVIGKFCSIACGAKFLFNSANHALGSLSAYYRREEELARSIKSAVTYPLVMLGMMVAVMLVLIIKVLPVFNQVFRQLGAGLTGVSGAVLRMGEAMSRYSVVFVIVAAAVAAVCAYFLASRKGRAQIRRFSTRFFGTKKLSEKIACARFASGMHLALGSGLNIDESLDTVSRLVEHPTVGQKTQTIRKMVAEGGSLADAITQTGMFTGVYARMVNIGVKTVAIDEVMRQIAEQYDDEIEQNMQSVIAKLEPTLVAILSVAVGMILLSVMLPLMGIMSNIG